MISLLLSSLLLLLAFIIVNSTPQISRQTPFFDPFRKEKQGPSKIKCFDRFLQARAPHILTPKEHVFDMPIPTNYSPTGRPPGEFHLRHSFKEITDILEFPSPPFNIFFTEMNANNYNYYYYYHIICYNNGDAVEDEDGSEDGPYVTSSYCIITNVELEILDNWTLNQTDLVHLRDLYEYNNSTNQIETIVDTSPVTLGMSVVASTATCTTISTNKDSGNNDGNVSNSDNSNNNNDSNSTSTTVTSTATTSTTTTTTTIDYNTSTNDKDNGIISTIHRTDTISIDSISSNSNNNNSSNNNINPCTEFAMGQSIELIHNNNNKSSSTYMTDAYPISTTTITYNTSTYDDNNNAYIAHSIHRTDTIQWFESILNNNNNKSISIFTTDTSPSADMTDATSTATTTTTTTIPSINYITITDDKDNRIILTIHRTDTLSIDLISSNNNNNNNNNKNSNIIRSSSAYMTSDPSTTTSTTINNKNDKNKTFHLSFIFKLISLYLIITKSLSSKEFKIALKEKHHHKQQQQQHYHGTHRHQSHLEQQRNHQHFKQQHHNMERMVTSIVLKLSLVAWDMWAFRNVF